MRGPFRVLTILFTVAAALPLARAQSRDQLAPTLSGAHREFAVFPPKGHAAAGLSIVQGTRSSSAEVQSITTFSGEFRAPGVGPQGHPRYRWFYRMAGRSPELGGSTTLEAPIIPVSVDLLDYDGSVRVVNGHKLHYSVKPFVEPVLNSPVFKKANYTSSEVPTQFVDAVQRAEFNHVMQNDWHTLLRPSVKAERTLSVPRGKYFFALQKDGSCCAFALVDINAFSTLLFPASAADTKTPVGSAEHSGDITTKGIATFLFPNTFLYANGNPNVCCVLGFHTYDFETEAENGNVEKRYVLNFASWISPGLFGPDFEDITALSHEMTEAVNNPFVGSDGVHGITPWWLSENGNCQEDLETGDVIEGLPESTVAIKTAGRVYHPQNEALLQWFEFQSPSTALGGAYSYPNQNVLTMLSPPEDVNCR